MRDISQELSERDVRYFVQMYRFLCWCALILTLIAIGEFIGIVYVAWTQAPSRFFVTTSHGDLIALTPAEKPVDAHIARSYIFEG